MSISTERKILSMNATYSGYTWPDIGLPKSPPIIGIRTDYVCCCVYDEDGEKIGEEMQKTEIPVRQEPWEIEHESILLYEHNDRLYYSVHPNYTMDILRTTFYVPDVDAIMDPNNPEQERYEGDLMILEGTSEEELFDFKFETDDSLKKAIGPEYCKKILQRNDEIKDKYLEDPEYLKYIGLPNVPESQFKEVSILYQASIGSIDVPRNPLVNPLAEIDPRDVTNFNSPATSLEPPTE